MEMIIQVIVFILFVFAFYWFFIRVGDGDVNPIDFGVKHRQYDYFDYISACFPLGFSFEYLGLDLTLSEFKYDGYSGGADSKFIFDYVDGNDVIRNIVFDLDNLERLTGINVYRDGFDKIVKLQNNSGDL